MRLAVVVCIEPGFFVLAFFFVHSGELLVRVGNVGSRFGEREDEIGKQQGTKNWVIKIN